MEIKLTFETLHPEKLSQSDKELLNHAKKAFKDAYAPYSKFKVGAALRLDNGVIVSGNNQENAAYPSGLCAERVAIFSAMANYAEAIVLEMIVYTESEGLPIAPCGACRQVLVEYEFRQKSPIRLLMINDEKVLISKESSSLLPIAFSQENLGK